MSEGSPRWLVWASLLSIAAAGCTSGSGVDAGPEDALASGAPQLQATATTGVLRGVVVDDAVRPLANASVELTGPSVRQAVTGTDGFFGFQGLDPGTYFVKVSKLAYEQMQQSAEVIAGVDDPRIVRVQLVFVPSEAPFPVAVKFEGFAQLIVPGANLGAIGNIYPCVVNTALGRPCENVTQDRSVIYLHDDVIGLQRVPDWAQMEMMWDSTQAATDWLSVRMTAHGPGDGAGVDARQAWIYSKSPLVHTQNRTIGEEWEFGTNQGWSLETFSGGNDQTCGGLPVRACSGFVLNQKLEYYFHFFYGYAPPEGWQFSESNDVPDPPR